MHREEGFSILSHLKSHIQTDMCTDIHRTYCNTNSSMAWRGGQPKGKTFELKKRELRKEGN